MAYDFHMNTRTLKRIMAMVHNLQVICHSDIYRLSYSGMLQSFPHLQGSRCLRASTQGSKKAEADHTGSKCICA